MKCKIIMKADYCGEPENMSFIFGFQAQILRTLEKRGMLTVQQLEKCLRCLKEPRR